MSVKINNVNFLLNSTNRKIIIIELKLEYRKVLRGFRELKLSHHIKKFYLLFLIGACIIPLFSIRPTATSDNKLLRLANEFQKADSSQVVFSEPSQFIPELNTLANTQDYQTYELKEGETLSTLDDRLANVNKESLEVNNSSVEIKAGKKLIIPSNDGLLIGYNKDTNLEEISKALNKDIKDIKNQTKNNPDGFVFIPSSTPKKTKTDFDTAIIKLRTPVPIPQAIVFNSNNRSNPSANNSITLGSSDFTDRLNSFISNTRGRSQHDGNGWSWGQCVSLVKQWQNFIGARSGYWPGNYPSPSYYAYLNGNTSMAPSTPSYRVVVVSDMNAMKAGDILITTGYPSHTGIATGRVGGGTFDIYDQNSPAGSPPKFNTYPNRMFIGALRYIQN
jgi:hypothetical protein